MWEQRWLLFCSSFYLLTHSIYLNQELGFSFFPSLLLFCCHTHLLVLCTCCFVKNRVVWMMRSPQIGVGFAAFWQIHWEREFVRSRSGWHMRETSGFWTSEANLNHFSLSHSVSRANKQTSKREEIEFCWTENTGCFVSNQYKIAPLLLLLLLHLFCV